MIKMESKKLLINRKRFGEDAFFNSDIINLLFCFLILPKAGGLTKPSAFVSHQMLA